jgi:mycoredoxin
LDYLKELFVQQLSANSSTNKQAIKLYVTTWCGDCRMARRWFDAHGIPYEYINIEEDEKAAEYVTRVNRGYQSVPTIVFPDGTILVEPSPRELATKFSV